MDRFVGRHRHRSFFSFSPKLVEIQFGLSPSEAIAALTELARMREYLFACIYVVCPNPHCPNRYQLAGEDIEQLGRIEKAQATRSCSYCGMSFTEDGDLDVGINFVIRGDGSELSRGGPGGPALEGNGVPAQGIAVFPIADLRSVAENVRREGLPRVAQIGIIAILFYIVLSFAFSEWPIVGSQEFRALASLVVFAYLLHRNPLYWGRRAVISVLALWGGAHSVVFAGKLEGLIETEFGRFSAKLDAAMDSGHVDLATISIVGLLLMYQCFHEWLNRRQKGTG